MVQHSLLLLIVVAGRVSEFELLRKPPAVEIGLVVLEEEELDAPQLFGVFVPTCFSL